MKINIESLDNERQRCIKDLMHVYKMDTFMSVKGYLQKLIDNLYGLGYYKDNESIFVLVKDSL